MRVKVGLFGLGDMLKFKHLGDRREEAIVSTEARKLPESYKVNDIARIYHPYKQHLLVKEVVDEGKDVKSFVLVPDGERSKELAPFKAGSYISLYSEVKEGIASRAYSLSSSPKEALEGTYRITVKRVKGGNLSNHLLDEVKPGTRLIASEPAGFLTYNPLRDAPHVVAVAGGVGITPFVSMAKAIFEGSEDFRLTILYGVRKPEDIIFGKELDEIASKTDKVKVVYVYSDVEIKGEEHGFVSAELIKKYGGDAYSIFATGPRGLLDYLSTELPKLGIRNKFIRLEQSPLYIDGDKKTYLIKVIDPKGVREIKAKGNETILQAFERAGISVRSKCHLGGCGFCRSRLVSGSYESTRFEKLNEVDRENSFIHPCCAYPRSNMEIEIFDY